MNDANKIRILIVEDEALIAEELQLRLERQQFWVVGVEVSGPKAVRTAEELRPSLVLMDIRLKGSMDGIEAAERIHRQFDIPVVFLTAHSDPVTFQRAKDTNPFGYVTKPFQERELVIAIEMALHRHHLEQRLKDSELRYSATLASIGDGVIATDNSGRVTFINYVAEALTKWRAAEVEGLPVEEVLSVLDEASREPQENPVLRALRAREIVRMTGFEVLLPRDGGAIPIDWNAAPVVDPKGHVSGAVMAFRDMRQRRLAEDALRNAESQLRQAQKMEAIGRLAGGIAHDFNNVVTVVFLNSEMLQLNDSLDAEAIENVREIMKAVDTAAALTGQLLAFSRRQVSHPIVLDVNEQITHLNKMLERLIGEDISLHTEFAAEPCRILADPSQVEQLVMNLVVNARDAMPEGGRLTISTRAVEIGPEVSARRVDLVPGRYVRISVRDTGTGIDEAIKPLIFDPFFTTKSAGSGTGLGLATVYGVVKQAGGSVEVESELGRGSTFLVHLPQAAAAAPEGAPAAPNEKLPRGTESVLVVEDQEGLRSIAAATLKNCGYTVYTARDGHEALQLCERFAEFQLLVTDVVMPGLGGRQLAERLQAKMPRLKVLYMSGYTDDAVLRHGVAQGEVAFLHKPFTAASLACRVREALDREARK